MMHLQVRRLIVYSFIVITALAILSSISARDSLSAEKLRVWAVGDGAVPESTDDALATMVAARGIDRLLYLGDVYESGTAEEFSTNYASSWGRFKHITSPTPGNHEWLNREEGYDPYWGSLALSNEGGHFYSFDVNGWHIVSLNSEEDAGPQSQQVSWLRQDLSSHHGNCTLALFHRPRFSAGRHGDADYLDALFDQLAGRAVAILSGHDHHYQRLRPERGVVQFVIGTGGRSLRPVDESDLRLAAYNDTSFGVMKLVLRDGRMDYAYVRADGRLEDRGVIKCKPHRSDELRLVVSVRSPKRGTQRSVRRIVGTARAIRRPPAITLVRRRGRKCEVLTHRSFRPARCRTRRFVRARGLRLWRYHLRHPLAAGRYRLTVRAVGPAGLRTAAVVPFRIADGGEVRG